MRESLEQMRKTKEYADTYGNSEEKEVVESSLKHLETADDTEEGELFCDECKKEIK